MSIGRSLLVRMTPVSKMTTIAEIGNVVVEKMTFGLAEVFVEDANSVSVTVRNLLPAPTTVEYITTREAYEETNISMKTLQRWAREHLIEAMKIGGRWLILRESIHRYIAGRNRDRRSE